MRALLDTHAFLWFVLDDPQLSATARNGEKAQTKLQSRTTNLISLRHCYHWKRKIVSKEAERQLAMGVTTT